MKIKKIISILLSFAILWSGITPRLPADAAENDKRAVGTTYYVSTINGKDSNNGQSKSTPFYSLQKINDIELQPGDQVLLECGSVFTNGYLHLREQSGSAEAPIIIDQYGTGAAPIIDTNGQGVWYQNYGKPLDSSSHKLNGYVSSSVLLYDTEYIEINNLEIINTPPAIEMVYNSTDVMNRTGVAAVAQNVGTVDHIRLNGLNIHDVIGNVYDKHMNNGGIYFTVYLPQNENATGISRFQDVIIENCIVENVNRWGIAVGYTAYWHHFTQSVIPDDTVARYGSGGVVIRNNYIVEPGGDAITTMYCDRPIVEYNVSDGAARQINTVDYSATGSGRVAAAIWPWKCKDAIFQYNEVFDTYYNQDGQAWDADYGDGAVYQYNYSHNNGGGAVMFCGVQAINNIFRYNISQNDLSGVINIPGNPDAHVYNNVFYMAEGVPFIRSGMTGGGMVAENNIIYYSGETARSEEWNKGSPNAVYNNNLYYNYSNIPASEKNAVIAAKGTQVFENPGTAPASTVGIANQHSDPSAATVFDGYKLAVGSPAIDKGIVIANNGGKDFFGNVLTGTPDIGIHEYDAPQIYLMSDYYNVDQINKRISGLENNIIVEEFLKKITYPAGMAVTVKADDGTALEGSDPVDLNGSVELTGAGETLVYTFAENSDNELKSSSFITAGTTIYVPITEVFPVSAAEVKEGIEVHETARVSIWDGDHEVTSGAAADGMTLRITAQNGAASDYTIREKNTYHWSLDYVDAKQGNVWFAQQKANGTYSNMTTYSSQYATWEGTSYAVIGLQGNKGAPISESRYGLLCDDLNTGTRKEGYSIAYCAPISGKLNLSFVDMGAKGNAYLRMAPSSGGSTNLTLTKNGTALAERIELPNNGNGVEIPAMDIAVERGDYIRVEINNTGTPSSPSAFATPIIKYLEGKEYEDTEAPTVPGNIRVDYITSASARIAWNASVDHVGVAGYKVYRNETLVADIPDTSFELTELNPDTEYTYTIIAYDAAGNESEGANITFTTAAIEDKNIKAAREALGEAVEQCKSIYDKGMGDYTQASWNAFKTAYEAAQAALASEDTDLATLVQSKTSLETANKGLTKTVKPVKLAAPVIQALKTVAEKKAAGVKITVDKVDGADSYTVYRKYGKQVKLIGNTNKNCVVYDKNPISNKKVSYYAVADSKETKYLKSDAGPAKSIKAAKATAKVTVRQVGKTLKVSWKKVKGAKGFVIYRSNKKVSGYTRVKVIKKGSILTFTDKKVKKGKKYFYRVVVKGTKNYSGIKTSKGVKVKK